MVALFNWEDEPQELKLSRVRLGLEAGRYLAVDTHDDDLRVLDDHALTYEVAPTAVKVTRVRLLAVPHLADFHASQQEENALGDGLSHDYSTSPRLALARRRAQ